MIYISEIKWLVLLAVVLTMGLWIMDKANNVYVYDFGSWVVLFSFLTTHYIYLYRIGVKK